MSIREFRISCDQRWMIFIISEVSHDFQAMYIKWLMYDEFEKKMLATNEI